MSPILRPVPIHARPGLAPSPWLLALPLVLGACRGGEDEPPRALGEFAPDLPGYLRHWLIAGPLPTSDTAEARLERAYIADEHRLFPRPGERLAHAGRELAWRTVRIAAGPSFEVAEAFDKDAALDSALAYAVTCPVDVCTLDGRLHILEHARQVEFIGPNATGFTWPGRILEAGRPP